MTCPSGKTGAPTAHAALRLAKEQMGRHRWGKGKPHLHPYRCPDCQGWHITSQKQRRSWT